MAEEAAMSQKGHGTSEKPVMKDLRWNCDFDTSDRICVSALLDVSTPFVFKQWRVTNHDIPYTDYSLRSTEFQQTLR